MLVPKVSSKNLLDISNFEPLILSIFMSLFVSFRFHLSLLKVVFGLFKLMLWSIWINQSMIYPLLQFIIICSQFNHLFLHFCGPLLLFNAL